MGFFEVYVPFVVPNLLLVLPLCHSVSVLNGDMKFSQVRCTCDGVAMGVPCLNIIALMLSRCFPAMSMVLRATVVEVLGLVVRNVWPWCSSKVMCLL